MSNSLMFIVDINTTIKDNIILKCNRAIGLANVTIFDRELTLKNGIKKILFSLSDNPRYDNCENILEPNRNADYYLGKIPTVSLEKRLDVIIDIAKVLIKECDNVEIAISDQHISDSDYDNLEVIMHVEKKLVNIINLKDDILAEYLKIGGDWVPSLYFELSG